MIDIDAETLIDFPTAAKHPAYLNPRNGRPAHVSSVWRHVMRGARAADGSTVKLEVVKLPGGMRTSNEAILRFVAGLTNPQSAPTPTPRTRKKQIDQAVSELEHAGFAVG